MRCVVGILEPDARNDAIDLRRKASALAARRDGLLSQQIPGIRIIVLRSGLRLELRINEPDERVGGNVRHRLLYVHRSPGRRVVVRFDSTGHTQQLSQRELGVCRILRKIRPDGRVDRKAPLRLELQHRDGRESLRVAADLVEIRGRHRPSRPITRRAYRHVGGWPALAQARRKRERREVLLRSALPEVGVEVVLQGRS